MTTRCLLAMVAMFAHVLAWPTAAQNADVSWFATLSGAEREIILIEIDTRNLTSHPAIEDVKFKIAFYKVIRSPSKSHRKFIEEKEYALDGQLLAGGVTRREFHTPYPGSEMRPIELRFRRAALY